MPKQVRVENLFEQIRNNSVYVESWKSSRNKRDPLITKWTEHIEKSTKQTRPKTH